MKSHSRILALLVLAAIVVAEPASAQRRGGGGFRGGGGMRGGGMPRATARPSVTSRAPIARPAASNIGANVNRGAINGINRDNINRNDANRVINNRNMSASDIATYRNNTNINRPVINNDIDIHDNGRWDWDDHYNGCCYHPVATAVGVAAGAALTAAAIGSIVYSLPPDCVVTVVNGMTYNQCGSTWYEPQFSGTSTTYVVVEPPQ